MDLSLQCPYCHVFMSFNKKQTPELIKDQSKIDFNASRSKHLHPAMNRLKLLKSRLWKNVLNIKEFKSIRQQIKLEENIIQTHSRNRKTEYMLCSLCDRRVFIK